MHVSNITNDELVYIYMLNAGLTVHMDSKIILCYDSVKILGVHVNNSLDWSEHISAV